MKIRSAVPEFHGYEESDWLIDALGVQGCERAQKHGSQSSPRHQVFK
jgi:hypothetical protein